MEPNPLDLIATDTLIEEVAKRYDWCVFMGRRLTGGDSKWETKRRYKGDIYCCIGLADNLADFLNDEVRYNETSHDGKGT